MTTIPQVARAMREIFTTTAEDAARTTRFVQRPAPLSGATFSQTVVFGFLGNPQATLEELTHTAAALGVTISPHALEQRLTAAAAACLRPVLRAAIARVITAEPGTIPLWQRFPAVYVQDSSTIVLPDVCAPEWPGCGGRTTSGTSAALKLQARLELCPGRRDVQLQAGRASDHAASVPGPRPAGALRLADWGSWSLAAWAALAQQEGFGVSRLQTPPAVYDTTGARRALLELVEAPSTDTVERAVMLGERPRLAARLLAVQVPQEVAETRRRR
jgi:hypothetical protein